MRRTGNRTGGSNPPLSANGIVWVQSSRFRSPNQYLPRSNFRTCSWFARHGPYRGRAAERVGGSRHLEPLLLIECPRLGKWRFEITGFTLPIGEREHWPH